MTGALIPTSLTLLLLLISGTRSRRWTVLTTYYGVWSIAGLVLLINPLQLSQLSDRGAAALTLAHGSVAVGAFAAMLGRPAARSNSTAIDDDALDSTRVLIAAAVTTLLVVVGWTEFRSVVGSALGQSIETLSALQVRYASSVLLEGSLGARSFLLSIGPLAAGLWAVAMTRGHRVLGLMGWLFVAWLVAINPSRTLMLQTILFPAIYLSLTKSVSRRFGLRWIAVVVAGIASLALFVSIGGAVGKAGGASGSHPLTAPAVYLAGPQVALGEALRADFPPIEAPGRTIWGVLRLLDAAGVVGSTPRTVALPVPIPFQFNNYGWVGDAVFDGGLLGLVLWGLILGALAGRIDATMSSRPVASPRLLWLAAFAHVEALASVTGLRLLWFGPISTVLIGYVFISWASEGRKRI